METEEKRKSLSFYEIIFAKAVKMNELRPYFSAKNDKSQFLV